MTTHDNRESWLTAAIEKLRPIFMKKKLVIPTEIMISCGFASTGIRSHHVGQCWSRRSSSNGINQIFISPTLSDPVKVLDTIAHELLHAIDDCKHKHGDEFKKIALALGMKGPMRSAAAGPEFLAVITELANELGPYPHGKLKVSHRQPVSRPRARAKCEKCGFEVPMYRKYLDYGPPYCPRDKTEMVALGNWEDS